MRTITNVFLLNLAISDILLGVLCMPVTLVGTLIRHFIFGEFFCKLIQFSQAASVAVSSWTLVAISCERYYAICHPLRSRRWQTRSHAYKIIACIWFGSMLCMLPIAMFSQLMPTSRQGRSKCRENWPSFALPYERTYNLFLDLILLVLPLIILSVAYILITRTLYVGMRIEKAMIFGGKQEEVLIPFQKKCTSGKSTFLSSSSSSATSASSTSRLKLNLSLRCHGPATCNNTSGVHNTQQQCNLDNNIQETDIFYQQQQHHQQQYNGKHQLQTQRLYHQNHFQNYHNQQQQQQQQHHVILHEEDHHQHHYQHQQQQQQHQTNKHCCESISRLCCKRSASSSANTYNGRPHLYCMRFATLKTTIPDKDVNASSNFCTSECCSSSSGCNTTNTINNSSSNAGNLPATSATASSSSSSTTYRYQMQNHHQQQHHTRCYYMQQVMPQIYTKTDGKLKNSSNKRTLKASESVLRRNNIAKNLESKKRVVKMLSVLVLEFFICWTPLYVINTVAMYIGSAIYEYIDYTSISVLQLLAYSSSCCNPITYCFMNANFRRAFWDTFKGIQWCNGKRFQRKRSTPHNGNLCLAGSIRVNSCTVQTVIDSPRL